MTFQLSFPRLKLLTFLSYGLLQQCNLIQVLLHLDLVVGELNILLLALELVPDHDSNVVLHDGSHLLLLLSELLGLFVQLLGLLNDLLFLGHEFVVDLAFLPFFLQKAHGLEGSLRLHHEG